MSSITFDTLKFANRLEKAGMPREQAAAEAEALQDALGEIQSSLQGTQASKYDLKELELKLEAKIESAKFDLLKWIVGLLLAQTGIIAALVKLL
ncbi:CCDC90 family protein [Deefgea piscis]|uniref:CCDC90 family protein n=1 Tax=Deefgea piscis TaxID=2739061 RepID=UPI001C7F2CE6|nr:CCDC90 family protein [Deefgea piscis]QZA80259.1 CCDC90 family protein [Deefgea piscis]